MLEISRPRIPAKTPVTYKTTFTFSQMTSATTQQSIEIVQLPANWVVMGVRIQNLTVWTATSLASLTIEIGTASFPQGFAAPYTLSGSIVSGAVQMAGAWTETTTSPQVVQALFTATGCSMDALTTGSCQVTLLTFPI